MTILEHAKAFFGHREAAQVADDERFEIQAEKRYRTMAGLDEPRERCAARAREHAKTIEPLRSKTW